MGELVGDHTFGSLIRQGIEKVRVEGDSLLGVRGGRQIADIGVPGETYGFPCREAGQSHRTDGGYTRDRGRRAQRCVSKDLKEALAIGLHTEFALQQTVRADAVGGARPAIQVAFTWFFEPLDTRLATTVSTSPAQYGANESVFSSPSLYAE